MSFCYSKYCWFLLKCDQFVLASLMLKLCQDWIVKSSALLFKVIWKSEDFSGDLRCLGNLVAPTAFLLKAAASSQKKPSSGWCETQATLITCIQKCIWQTEFCSGPVAADSVSAYLIILDILKRKYLECQQVSIHHSHTWLLSGGVLGHVNIHLCFFLR